MTHYCKSRLYFCVYYVDVSSYNVENFIEECALISKLDHPNVLNLIGVSMNTEDGTLYMIMPFMHHGDVKSFLKSKRGDVIEFDHFPMVCMHNVYTEQWIYMYILSIYVCVHRLSFMHCFVHACISNFFKVNVLKVIAFICTYVHNRFAQTFAHTICSNNNAFNKFSNLVDSQVFNLLVLICILYTSYVILKII